MALAFLALSTLLQGLALGVAVRIALSRATSGWTLLATGLALMFVRRAFSFQAAVLDARPGDPIAEGIALCISALFVVGLLRVARDQSLLAAERSGPHAAERHDVLRVRAVALGAIGLGGTCLLGFLAYTSIQTVVTDRLSQDTRHMAEMLASAATSAARRHASPVSEVQALWEGNQERLQSRFVTVIDSEGRVALHSSHPETVGSFVGDTVLSLAASGDRYTVMELLREGKKGSGLPLDATGREQSAAYVYSPDIPGLVAVHVRAQEVDAQVRRAVLPWLVGLGSVLFLMLPVSFGLLYHVTSISQSAAWLAEKKSRETEDRYRQIVETTNQGVWMLDADGHTTFTNARMAELLGCSTEELLSKTLFDFLDSEGRRQAEASLERRRQGIAGVQEVRFIRADGRELWGSVSTAPVFSESGAYAGALAMVSDVSERRAMEEQVRQSQKMQAVGQLAGGVAHDFNNLLTVISVNAALLADGPMPAASQRMHAGEIVEATERAAELTRRLLAFSRKRQVKLTTIDLSAVVAKMVTMLRRVLGEDIELETEYGPDVPSVLGDAALLEQVILNLAINARDAMPRGGRLSIATGVESAPVAYGEEEAPVLRAILTVTDSGTGIPQDVLPHIFEPFFTTKELERGTGLGLAVVYGIVQQHRGTIDAKSEPGRGTTFTIRVPIHGGEPNAASVSPAQRLVATVPGATVLVAEDDLLVRPVVVGVLTRAGYRVLAAGSGREALGLFREHRAEVRLLLSDLLMPGGMTGKDLALKVRELAPDLPIVLMTGYGADLQERDGAIVPGVGFLQKPCSPAALVAAVNERLSR